MAVKFLVDRHAAKLAKWLRFLGFDAEIASGDLYALAGRAVREGRILLTRTRRAAEISLARALVLRSDEPGDQLRQVVKTLDLSEHMRPFSRCPVCNVPLAKVDKERVRHRVPPHTFATHEEFSECPSCKRVFWEGSHVQGMRKRLRDVIQGL